MKLYSHPVPEHQTFQSKDGISILIHMLIVSNSMIMITSITIGGIDLIIAVIITVVLIVVVRMYFAVLRVVMTVIISVAVVINVAVVVIANVLLLLDCALYATHPLLVLRWYTAKPSLNLSC